MQIKLDNVKYKDLKDLSFTIEDNKITGIVSNDIFDLIRINYIISSNEKEDGKISYSNRYSKKKIGLITIKDVYEMINGISYDYITCKEIDDKLYDLLNINEKLLERNVSTLSTSEKIKILFLNCLSNDYDVILINGILEQLDNKLRKKIINIIINLKKFEEKTIIVSSTDIDIIYEFIDNLILIINGKSYFSSSKFSIFDEINDITIKKPFIKQIENMVYEKSKIDLGNNETINELIKSIYREIR